MHAWPPCEHSLHRDCEIWYRNKYSAVPNRPNIFQLTMLWSSSSSAIPLTLSLTVNETKLTPHWSYLSRLYLLQNPNPTLSLSLCELRESSNGQLWRTQQAHLSLRVVVTLHTPPLQTRRPTTASIPILRPTRIRPDPVPPDLLQPRPASLQGHPFPNPLRSPCPRHIRRWHLRHF